MGRGRAEQVGDAAMDLGSDETDGEGVAQYVTFQNGDRVYGLEITRVVEIRQWAPVSDLPNQPAYTRGVLNIRGEVIPVHDLRARFGGALTEATENHVVLIVALGDQKAGVLVDAVSDIVSVTGHDVRSVPDGAQHTDD
ncbi:MAG: chemotaxis protein CheW, partial [Pseudomonadota bacterium]